MQKIVKSINQSRQIKSAINPKSRLRSENVLSATPVVFSKSSPARIYQRSRGNSFILGHVTLGRLRTNKNFEADCSNNGNNGTWQGTGIDGAQYIMPAHVSSKLKLNTVANPVAGVVSDESIESNDGAWIINSLGYYSFNSNANDSGIYGNDGTVTNGTYVSDHLRVEEHALSFDGTTSVSVPDSASLNPVDSITLDCWIKVRSYTNTWSPIIYKGTSAADRNFSLWLHSSGRYHFSFSVSGSNKNLYSTYNVLLDRWQHIVCTRNSATGYCAIYIDNVLRGAGTFSTGAIDTNSNPVRFGHTDEVDATFSKPDVIVSKINIMPCFVSTTDVTNLYNITSVQNLDSPLTSVTDSDGTTLQGYRLFSPLQSTTTPVSVNYIVLDADYDAPKNNHTLMWSYVGTGTDNTSRVRVASGTLDSAYGFVDMDLAYDFVRVESVSDDYWAQAFATGIDINDGKVHRFVLEFTSTATNLYVDGSLRDFKSANNDTTYSYFRYRYFGSGMSGILGGINVIARSLTPTEKSAIFAGTDVDLTAPMQRLSCASFNDTDNYVECVNRVTIGTTTAIFFVLNPNLVNTTNEKYAAQDGNDSNSFDIFSHSSGNALRFQRWTGTSNQYYDWTSSTATLTLYADNTIFIIQENGTDECTFIINGVEETVTATVATFTETQKNLVVGAGRDRTFLTNGKMDEFMIFNTSLSAQDRQDILDNKFDQNHSKYGNCAVWWSFDNPLLGDRRSSKVLVTETDN